MKKTNIIINLQIEGVHNWANCDIDEVGFLKYPHRHIFHICCKKEVSHSDRDIEIIMLKRQIEAYLHETYGKVCQFKSQSCEMIAEEIYSKFALNYCSVLEDGENGAEVVYIEKDYQSIVFGGEIK